MVSVEVVIWLPISPFGHATVTQTVSRLKEAGLVDSKPYGPLKLTRKGQRVAEKSKERHEIVRDFLLSIGVPDDVAASDAEGIEHHVSEATLECFRRQLGKR